MNCIKSIFHLYLIPARPTTSPATVTVNSFNTSLPAGKVLVNFTANTTDGNNVNFTISTLVPNANYTIRRDGALYNISRADSTGMIIFNNSLWSYNRTFTVEQVIEFGNSQGYIKNLNLTSVQGASVALYYQGGSPAGSTAVSGADGKFQFSNLPVATYYVNATKDGFFSNRSLVFTVAANSTVNAGNVTLVNPDVNGDGEKNLLDLTEIIRIYLNLNPE
ncbi:MAG: carboxypeptidase-like regulatory domain-containing protein [Candidatus Methanoperedens sp.]|nr:carboxypeptidase-like regulatory domain-containing protein [Candidatus Methanoperedens sp.]